MEDHDCKEEDRRRREINKNWHHGKYEAPPGDTHLYNVSSLHEAVSVVGICEGELDALVASVSGLPSVGVPGSNNWKPFYSRLFDDFERVVVIGDGDTAGRQFAANLAAQVMGGVPRPMPRDHDVNSYVLEYGANAFLEYVGG